MASLTKSLPVSPQKPLPAPAPGADPLQDLLFRLVVALHAAGASSARLEASFTRCADRLGLPAQILATPTSVMVAFGRGGEGAVRLARVDPGEVDLSRLAQIDALLEALEGGRERAPAVELELAALGDRPTRVAPWLTLLAATVASGTAAFFFRGSVVDAGLSALLGALVAGLGRLAARSEHRRPLFEPGASLVVAALATALVRLGLPIDALAVTLASLIALVPGYGLTVALSELAARHLVSATARLAAVGGTLLGMGLGVGLGQSIGSWVPELTQRPPWGAAGPWAVWTAVVSCAFAFTVLFRARPRDLAAILAATLLAFLGARAGTAWFGPELGGFVGALALGLVANTTARITRRPASTVLVPGLMVLVPGSLGFRSVAQFLSADALSGVETAFRMVIVAMALVGGLLAANLLLPPRRSL